MGTAGSSAGQSCSGEQWGQHLRDPQLTALESPGKSCWPCQAEDAPRAPNEAQGLSSQPGSSRAAHLALRDPGPRNTGLALERRCCELAGHGGVGPRQGSQAERALSSRSSQSNPSQSLTHLKKCFLFSQLGTEDGCHRTATVPLPNLFNLPAKRGNTLPKVFSPTLRVYSKAVLNGPREQVGPRQTDTQRSPQPPAHLSPCRPEVQVQNPTGENPGWRH